MAFDQSTRNRLQKFVNDARHLLIEEFTGKCRQFTVSILKMVLLLPWVH